MRCSARDVFSEPFPGHTEQILLFPRENQCELEASGSGSGPGSVPVHTLPSTYLQKVPEQPEDADNQKNVTRMIQPPLDKTTTVNIPVTITAPPGDTTVIPSECLCPLGLAGNGDFQGVMGALLGTATLERGRQGAWKYGSVIATQTAGTQGSWWLWKTPEIPWRWLSQATPFVRGKEQGKATTPMCDPAALGSCDIPELFTAPHLEQLHPPCPSPELSAEIYRWSQDPCAQPPAACSHHLGADPWQGGNSLEKSGELSRVLV